MKRKLIILLSTLSFTIPAKSAQLSWSGEAKPVISIVPSSSTGLDEVCVAYQTDGLSVGVPAASASEVKWYRYSTLGGGYAEEVTSGISYADGKSVLGRVEGDMGYIVETAGRQYCFWVVDYSLHPFSVTSVGEAAEKDCSFTMLDVSGKGEEIVYYGINGRRFTLDRNITVSYLTLLADTQNDDPSSGETGTPAFVEVRREESFASLQSPLRVPAALCPTEFTVSGDRFLREWGEETEATSATIAPYAVATVTIARQEQRDVDNEVGSGSGGGSFGGSAPCRMSFEAAVTDGALFKEWQISRSQEFDDAGLRIQELSFDYTFTEEGQTYVRFVCANADGSCEAHGDVYTISIGTSSLRCPNAFSPNGDGVNDEWKVSYSSIISFECHIFDRYGHKMTSLSDPSQGWDGKYKGKTVPSGAYYYVIKAKGADGKVYDLAGDINIVNYKQ